MLFYYLRLIGQFYQDMRRQKMRTFLTVFGITWGTIAVVLLMAFGVGIKANSLRAMHGMGTNIVIMGGNRTSLPYKGLGTGRWIPLREEDVALLKEQVPGIELVSPEKGQDVRVVYKHNARTVNCAGVYPDYGLLRNQITERGGRFINQLDLESKRRMIYIGNGLRDNLFGKDSDPVGKLVTVNGIPFVVVGVLHEKVQTSSYGGGMDRNRCFIPYSTYRETFGGRNVQRLIWRAADPAQTTKIRDEVFRVLGNKYQFDPKDKEALWMWDTSEGEKFMGYFFLGFQAFLALGGILTLVVGGIGVANIMYIVVRERRREVGVKMALGATSRNILTQFMVETLLIVFLGGGLGFAFSYGVVQIFHLPMLKQLTVYIGIPQISTTVALGTIGVIGLIGFAAGYAPARRAAAMDPIQALEF